jgi:hypothetical protein
MDDQTKTTTVDDDINRRLTNMLVLSMMTLLDEGIKRAVLSNHNILEYLILVRLNHRLQIPKIVVSMWLTNRVLLKDEQGVFINPVVEDLIDQAIETLTKEGNLELVSRDAERRAKQICKKLSW